MPSTLLPAKLNRPRLPRNLILRDALFDYLQSKRGQPLFLISAPAGYGKTTLADLWLNSIDATACWLSLDERDDNLTDFAAYLHAAVASNASGFGQAVQLVLEAPTPPNAEDLADMFLRDLARIDGELFIVLDDYHELRGVQIHQFVERTVEYLPDNIHLVLLTRSDPPLRLSRLRGRGQLVELRTAQLRFSLDEAATLLKNLLDGPIPAEVVALLNEITEGWPVGLQLAALSMSQHADQRTLATSFAHNGNRLVADYLVNEVLREMPESERSFLLECSVLDELCAPLCYAVTGNSNAAQLLTSFWQRNLFLVALDDDGHCYRFHHLFRNLLRHHLDTTTSKEEQAALHNRASRWFEDQGNVDQAVVHSIAASDVEHASRMVEAHIHEALNQERWRMLERWLNLLPNDARQRPALLVAQAWMEQFRFRHTTIMPLVELASQRLEAAGDVRTEDRAGILGNIHALRATALLFANRPHESLQASRLALETLPDDQLYARGMAEHFYARALHHTGDMAGAIAFVNQLLGHETARPNARTLRLLLALSAIHYDQGNTNSLERTSRTFHVIAQRTGHPVSIAWATAFAGWVHYQRNELVSAAENFSAVLDAAPTAHFRCVLECLVGSALTLNAQNRTSEAHAVAERLTVWLTEHELMQFLPAARTLHAQIDLTAGILPGERIIPFRSGAHLTGLVMWLMPALVQVQIWLRSGKANDLAQAGQLLAECRVTAEEMNIQRRLIEISALQALHSTATGAQEKALTYLFDAVTLAAQNNALRIILDLGPELRLLLQQLYARNKATPIVLRLLSSYAMPAAPAQPLLTVGPMGDLLIPTDTLLTNRETDVLLLLAERLTNKEIAQRLTLTPRTVKKHTINIFQKLQVDNRRAAVSQARAMGILPPL